MCVYKHLFSGQVHLSFQKSWQNGEGARQGKKFQPQFHILFGRLSDCILTVMPLSRKAMPLCFQIPSSIQKLLTTLHRALFTRQISSIYTLSKWKLLLQFMLEGWGHGERAGWEESVAQPSRPLPALPVKINVSHLSRWWTWARLCSFTPLRIYWIFSATNHIYTCGNDTPFLIPVLLSASPSLRALYWTTSGHPQWCSCYLVTSTAVM